MDNQILTYKEVQIPSNNFEVLVEKLAPIVVGENKQAQALASRP